MAASLSPQTMQDAFWHSTISKQTHAPVGKALGDTARTLHSMGGISSSALCATSTGIVFQTWEFATNNTAVDVWSCDGVVTRSRLRYSSQSTKGRKLHNKWKAIWCVGNLTVVNISFGIVVARYLSKLASIDSDFTYQYLRYST